MQEWYIYEKDILKFAERYRIVEWNDKKGAWMVKFHNGCCLYLDDIANMSIVVGKIHENKDLYEKYFKE